MSWNNRLVCDQAKKKVSSSLLKFSTLSESIFLTVTGRRLKMLAPFTERHNSLAPLTAAGALGSTCYVLPLLSLVETGTLYTLTTSWDIFQRNIIIYLSHSRSCEHRFIACSLSQWFRFSMSLTLELKWCWTAPSFEMESWSPEDQSWLQ